MPHLWAAQVCRHNGMADFQRQAGLGEQAPEVLRVQASALLWPRMPEERLERALEVTFRVGGRGLKVNIKYHKSQIKFEQQQRLF